MKVIDDDDASLQPKIGADGFPFGGTVTRARDYNHLSYGKLPLSSHYNASWTVVSLADFLEIANKKATFYSRG